MRTSNCYSFAAPIRAAEPSKFNFQGGTRDQVSSLPLIEALGRLQGLSRRPTASESATLRAVKASHANLAQFKVEKTKLGE
jgi:hypothetical protein